MKLAKHLQPQSTTTTQTHSQPQGLGSVATVAPPSRPDRTDEFWGLFSAWNFLQADPPAAGKKPDWRAVSTYPIAQRLASRGKLIAARPQTKTNFLTIDIDATSRNHFTQQNEYALARLQAALEERLGLVEPIVIRSSDSGGLHFWYWLDEPQNSYQLAAAVAIVLKDAGFVLEPGHLETFPNCKSWIDSENPSDWSSYQAIRVPFQEPGSYLLDPENYYAPLLHPHADQREEFLRLVQHSQRRNALTSAQIEAVLATRPQPLKRVSVRGNQYLSDLLAKVRDGWTGSSQTRQLFFDTTRLLRVFGHLLLGTAPFRETDRLADAILDYVSQLPGREQFCGHNHELETLAWKWAKWTQSSKYKPYERRHRRVKAVTEEPGQGELTHNEQQRQTARERILQAIAQLLNQNQLPATINARRDALEALGLNRKTLYRHKDLWHPECLSETLKPLPGGGVTPTAGNIDPSETLKPLPGGGVTPMTHKELVANPAAPSEQAERLQEVGGSGGKSTGQVNALTPEPTKATPEPEKTTTEQVAVSSTSQVSVVPVAACQQVALENTSATQVEYSSTLAQTLVNRSEALPTAVNGESPPPVASVRVAAALTPAQTEKRQQQQRREVAQAARMQVWLESGDPILVKEAQAWFAARAERLRSELLTEETDSSG